jgi:hypothetical protein
MKDTLSKSTAELTFTVIFSFLPTFNGCNYNYSVYTLFSIKSCALHPFITFTLAINSGGNCCSTVDEDIALSITTNASLLPVIDLDPLNTILLVPFTPFEDLLICRPDTFQLTIVPRLDSLLG